MRITPYTYIFDNRENIKLETLSNSDLLEFNTRLDDDLSSFIRNQKNGEYQEMIDLWTKVREELMK